jgi:SAM-dependent methyltransferase
MKYKYKSQMNYYDSIYKQNGPIKLTEKTIKEVERFISNLNNTDGHKCILEIGCGDGLLTGFLLDKGYRVVAVDISSEAILKVNEKYKPFLESGALKTVVSDLFTFFRTTTEKYDMVLGAGIIHHINKDDWPELFRMSYDILNPNGIFSCGPEPNAFGIYTLLWRLAPTINKLCGIEYNWDVEKNTIFMYPNKLRKILLSVGFKQVRITPYQVLTTFKIPLLDKFNDYLLDRVKGIFSIYISIIAVK